jgi:hypothetical protein
MSPIPAVTIRRWRIRMMARALGGLLSLGAAVFAVAGGAQTAD